MTLSKNLDCKICNGKADNEFKRFEVWSNEHWRLTASSYKLVKGFCYLESKRHIEAITELDGIEMEEFGSIISKVTKAIKISCQAKLVYVYIYGGHIPHLHVHLAPHTENDIFQDDVIYNEKFSSNDLISNIEMNDLKVDIRKNIEKNKQQIKFSVLLKDIIKK